MEQIEVSIIIVSYNTSKLLKECIESVIEKTEAVKYEIIVVDNCSTDGSVEMLRNHFPQVQLIASSENLGFGRANNLGVENARGTNILFLNPDTLLINNAIKILNDYLNDNPSVGMCGGNLYTDEGEPALSFQRIHTTWSEFVGFMPDFMKLHWRKTSNWFNTTGKPLEIDCISGADIMTRREIIDKTGCFDPDFFMYYEDMELSIRVKRSCWKLISVPQAEIIHLAGQSCTVSERKLAMLLETKYIFYVKVKNLKYAHRIYRLNKTGYETYKTIYSLVGNKEKAAKYRLRSEINNQAWKNFSSNRNIGG